MNKKMILELAISHYVFKSKMLSSNYKQWVALSDIKVGDVVIEESSFFLVARPYNDQDYEKAYAHLSNCMGTVLEIGENNMGKTYKIESLSGTIIDWGNCKFSKFFKISDLD